MYQPNYSRGELPGHKSRHQAGGGCSLFHGKRKKKIKIATCSFCEECVAVQGPLTSDDRSKDVGSQTASHPGDVKPIIGRRCRICLACPYRPVRWMICDITEHLTIIPRSFIHLWQSAACCGLRVLPSSVDTLSWSVVFSWLGDVKTPCSVFVIGSNGLVILSSLRSSCK